MATESTWEAESNVLGKTTALNGGVLCCAVICLLVGTAVEWTQQRRQTFLPERKSLPIAESVRLELRHKIEMEEQMSLVSGATPLCGSNVEIDFLSSAAL